MRLCLVLVLAVFAVGLDSAAAQNAAPGSDAFRAAMRKKILQKLQSKLRFTPEQMARALAPADAGADAAGASVSGSSVAGSPGARESIVSGDEGVESEVHAAINPTDSNNIIVSPIRTSASPTEGLLCPIYSTKDFGATWRKSSFRTVPVGATSVVGGGDPVVAFDEDGTAYLVYIALFIKGTRFDTIYGGLYWAKSVDGGATWSHPTREALAYTSLHAVSGGGDFFDKEWVAVDRTSGPHRNSVYVAFLHMSEEFGQKIVVRSKRAGAEEFSATSTPVSDESFEMVQFSGVEVDGDGRVHVTFFGSKDTTVGYELWHAVSSDGGVTFSAPTVVAPVHHPRFSPGAPPLSVPGIEDMRLYPAPQLAVDRTNTATRGNLYLTWTADGTTSDRDDGLDIYFSRSTDGGAGWSEPTIVNNDARGRLRHQHYSNIAVSPEGVVALSWYDRRADPEHRQTHYYLAYSFDGGLTFTAGAPVSAQPTDFASVGERNGRFGIGEYTQVLATRGYAIPVWTDGRQGNGDLNIVAAFVPIGAEAAGAERVTSVSGEAAIVSAVHSSGELSVRFTLGVRSRATITLFDALGRPAATLGAAAYEAGEHTATLDVRSLPAGRYYFQLDSDAGRTGRAITILK